MNTLTVKFEFTKNGITSNGELTKTYIFFKPKVKTIISILKDMGCEDILIREFD